VESGTGETSRGGSPASLHKFPVTSHKSQVTSHKPDPERAKRGLVTKEGK